MSFDIHPIPKSVADEWVRTKHYSHRVPIFWKGFGLYENGSLQGIAVYGQPSPPIQRFAFTDRDFRLYELSRLVIQTKTKNAASILVGRSLNMLDKPCAVVSYADTEWGHAGIVYQATNWLYTGATKSHDHMYIIDGKRVHPSSLADRGITSPKKWAKENGIETVPPMEKHRYFYLVGSKFQKKSMRNRLTYPVINTYPKLPYRRYDDGPIISGENGHTSIVTGKYR